MRTVSYPAVAVPTAIKTSIATATALATYTGAALNGAIGAAVMDPPRNISVTTSASAGAYTLSGITITGTDHADRVQTEVLTLTQTGGGQTVVGSKAFKTVTSISVPAMSNTAGTFTFGVRDIFCIKRPTRIRIGTTGALKIGCDDGTTDVIPALAAAETIALAPPRIYGDASTTATNLTLFFDK